MKNSLIVLILFLAFIGCKKVDENPISCSFITPVNNDTILQNYRVAIEVSVTSNSSEITLIEVFIDDDLGISTNSTQNTSWNWNTTGISKGLHKIEVKATDNNGHTSYSVINVVAQENTITFNPSLSYGSMSDIDGNTYKTITIGTQTWMAEDLRTSRYRNGTKISNYKSVNTGFLINSINSGNVGFLYDWNTVDDYRNLAPIGWHIPTETEWNNLMIYLGGYQEAGSKLIETGNSHWKITDFNPTNSSGFTGIPYNSKGNIGLYWSSTENPNDNTKAIALYLSNYPTMSDNPSKSLSLNVRCVKD